MRMQHSVNENKDVNLDPRLDPKCMDVEATLADVGVPTKIHRFFSGLSFEFLFEIEMSRTKRKIDIFSCGFFCFQDLVEIYS